MSNQSDLAKSAAGFNGDPLSIDTANNRVGVGTVSPLTEIGFPIGNDIKISQAAGTDHLAGNAGSIGLTIIDGGGHSGVFVNNSHDGTYSDQFITFKTAEGGVSTATERMRIDPAGRVTMPYQPHGAWTQTLSATPSVSILRNNGPVSSVSVSSTGQNGTIGRFTAPVTGLYHFNVTTSQITAGSSNLLVVIYINGTLGGTYLTNAVPPTGEIIDMRSASNIQDGPAYSHAIYLSSSDYVEFSVYRITTGYTDSGNIICSAYLIG